MQQSQNETRVFFVVDSLEDNEELFTTLEHAENYYNNIEPILEPRLYIAIVKNAFLDTYHGRSWNYTDLSDTFTIIKIIKNNTI